MTFAAKPFAAAVNHLLARESWARDRLIPYAGKTARLDMPPVTLTLLVQPDGYLSAVEDPDAQALDVSIALAGDTVAAFMQGGQAAVMKHVKIEGDAEFATQIAKLAEHLRWEPEEDLARLVGDAAAYRIAMFVRDAGARVRRTGRNVLDSLAEYWLDEDPQVVRRASLADFDAELARARDALARVEKRIERLEQKIGARAGDRPRMRIFRFIKILYTVIRFGLDEVLLSRIDDRRVRLLLRITTIGRRYSDPPAVRLRHALESLGPIFVKFGQVLSTRRDLLSPDFASELAKLQDQVPPFDSSVAISIVEKALGAPVDELFDEFEREPVASASIAQVHFAKLKEGVHSGKAVAVKVLRPNMLSVINSDLALMRDIAIWTERLWPDGRRLKPREVVAEFDKYLHDELDLMREAANGSQLRRNFVGLDLLLVPEMFWDYSTSNVLVMERMSGVPISQVDTLRAAGVDIKKLAREGVEIFFTQVFRDGFFHADMHPGNIRVSLDPNSFGRYIALDFGIVGALSDFDKKYLAQNFLAFFKRDYHRVATLHLESGWVPPDTRVEELESAIRAVCEPYFDRALKDISLGQVLMRLFSTSRRFNVEIQPQLVLLQKTMLNVEGLGRSLDPDLDLWKTAKPYLELWMTEQIGLRGWYERFKVEAPQWSKTLPQLPRLVHNALMSRQEAPRAASEDLMRQILVEQKRTNRLLQAVLMFGLAVGVGAIIARVALAITYGA